MEVLSKQSAKVIRCSFMQDVVKEVSELVHFREIKILVGEERDNPLQMV
jgi:hypothetical protein